MEHSINMGHTCNNIFIRCMDYRFQDEMDGWAKAQGLENDYDLVVLAGAQKSILDYDTSATDMKQVELSKKLHESNTVILMAHQDCGAYGGSAAFENWEQEREKYIADLNAAEEKIVDRFPGTKFRKLILTFDGDVVSFEEVYDK